MCWCEQISPLAHSSQATWQPFNLSHRIEMHNTHLLGRAGQLRRISHIRLRFWLRAICLRLSTNNGRHCENPLCHVTLASMPVKKWQLPRWTVYFFVQMQLTGRYDHRFESDFVFLLCRNLSYLKCDSRVCHREAHPTLVKRGHAGPAAHAWSHFCFLSSRNVVWPISTQNPSCVALHNVWFDSFAA